MNGILLARKGEAVPTGISGSNHRALAYMARRVISFGDQGENAAFLPTRDTAMSQTFPANTATPPKERPAARFLACPRNASTDSRKRFTFRLDEEMDKRFRKTADTLGFSRQKLLERALDRYLGALDGAYDESPSLDMRNGDTYEPNAPELDAPGLVTYASTKTHSGDVPRLV